MRGGQLAWLTLWSLAASTQAARASLLPAVGTLNATGTNRRVQALVTRTVPQLQPRPTIPANNLRDDHIQIETQTPTYNIHNGINENTNTHTTLILINEESNPTTTEASGNSMEIPNVTVETEYGPVRGVQWDDDRSIVVFFDVPYGTFSKPFEGPKKPVPWSIVRETLQHQSRCPQQSATQEPPSPYGGSTDCLTLTVVTHSSAADAPVLFHIYDGEFDTGSADPVLYNPENLIQENIVVVLPNYRLGPLGFLCMRNETAPGNAALKDLAMALKWTNDNIANFGGNASRITISGDGTAGALAGYLALSPESSQYIKGVITESGSVLAPWAIDRNPEATASQLAQKIGKAITDDMDIRELIFGSYYIKFRPCVEANIPGAFLNDTPWQMLKRNNHNIRYMIGSANHAGMHEAAVQDLREINDNFSDILPNDLKFKSDDEKLRIGNKMRDIYFYGPVTETHEPEVSLYHTDAHYLGPALRTARLLVEGGATVYFYEFSYVGELNHERETLQEVINVQGAARRDLMGYLFVRDNLSIGDVDERVAGWVNELWGRFITEGEPSIGDLLEWRPLRKIEERHEESLVIDNEVKMKSSGVHYERLHLWTKLYQTHYIESNSATTFPLSQVLMLLISTLATLQRLQRNY